MRLLHTSDLHLGARIAERDRIDEQREILNWLLDTVEEHNVSALLVAGDIFDAAFPPASARADWYQFLAELRNRGCSRTFVIGGNHDSPLVLGAPQGLAAPLGIRIWGGAGAPVAERIVEVDGVRIAALPYIRERDVRRPRSGEAVGERDRAIRDAVREYYHTTYDALSGSPGPSIALGHLSVIGASAQAGARDLYVGGIGAIAADELPPFDYLALGHFHSAQTLREKGVVRYSGAPRASDFGGSARHSVTIIDVEGADLSWHQVDVPVFQPLLRLTGSVDNILEQLPTLDASAWVECVVEGGGSADRIWESLIPEGPTILKVRRPRLETSVQRREDAPDLGELTVDELFRLKAGEDFERLVPLFRDLVAAAQEGHE